MKRLLALALSLMLCGCAAQPTPGTTIPPETTIPVTTVPETTVPETTVPVTTAPLHSPLYLEGIQLEEVVTNFNDVVMHMEYGDGDYSRVQKWLFPILYCIEGDPTDEDLQVLQDFFRQLNAVHGFPGIAMAEGLQRASLTISFLDEEDFHESFSDVVGEDAWGAVQFWYYDDTNEIYDARIGYRTDIDQIYRNSILLEEIVNCLGITDTELREDSIVYQYSNDNLSLSDMDWLILKLLYDPAIECGMDVDACHAVIEQLYY
ncbi:MAG: DUF2927 domain-containing protein [Oscillospiraceae bacterium]|nr:DUF2927 domain-containing protein [Oscillospiraceae bacterium]